MGLESVDVNVPVEVPVVVVLSVTRSVKVDVADVAAKDSVPYAYE